MKTVRFGTFETNSSSCHAITAMRKSDWEKFKNGETFIKEKIDVTYSEDDYYGLRAQAIKPESFVSFDELKAYLKEQIKKGDKLYDAMQKFCSFNSIQEAKAATESDFDLDEFINWQMDNYVAIYNDNDETGWGMAEIEEIEYCEPHILIIDREISC